LRRGRAIAARARCFRRSDRVRDAGSDGLDRDGVAIEDVEHRQRGGRRQARVAVVNDAVRRNVRRCNLVYAAGTVRGVAQHHKTRPLRARIRRHKLVVGELLKTSS
jgi:hypothetical protein